MTRAWSSEELQRIGGSTEVQVSSERGDGTVRPYVTIWIVQVGDELYVRSAYGTDNPWYRRAKASGAGRIRAGRFERGVTFAQAGSQVHPAIDAATTRSTTVTVLRSSVPSSETGLPPERCGSCPATEMLFFDHATQE